MTKNEIINLVLEAKGEFDKFNQLVNEYRDFDRLQILDDAYKNASSTIGRISGELSFAIAFYEDTKFAADNYNLVNNLSRQMKDMYLDISIQIAQENMNKEIENSQLSIEEECDKIMRELGLL